MKLNVTVKEGTKAYDYVAGESCPKDKNDEDMFI